MYIFGQNLNGCVLNLHTLNRFVLNNMIEKGGDPVLGFART